MSASSLDSPVSTPTWLRLIERGFLVAGGLLFVVLVYQIGAQVVFDNLRLVGWGICLIILQELLAYAANTLGWRYAFPAPRPSIAIRYLFAARIAGDAINYLTPTATLGGEFVRVRLLRGRATNSTLVASVTIAKLSQTIGQIVFIILGLLVVLAKTPVPPALQQGLFIGLAGLTILTALLLVAQRHGLFAPLLRMLHALGLPYDGPGLRGSMEQLDDEIARFGGWSLLRPSACFFIGWAAGAIEVYLILLFLDIPVTVERALAIEVLSATIDAILFFVPGKVGTQEGGKVLIFSLLGLEAAKGLSLGILRRIRELIWAGIGLLILSRLQGNLRPFGSSAVIGNQPPNSAG